MTPFVRGLPLVALALACSPPVEPPPTASEDSGPVPAEPEPVRQSDSAERSATVRIDAEPGGKKEQGVWLEFETGARWIVDYHPGELWPVFADRAVLVTGHCYQPFGQAIAATHFEVETLSVADRQRGVGPLFSIGPAETLVGTFAETAHPEGSKLAGEQERWFRTNDGASFHLFGFPDPPPSFGEPATIRARRVELDMSFTATTGGDRIWVERIGEREGNAPTPIACP